MYAFLRGTVAHLTDSEAWIDVNGVGYEVQISPATASQLSSHLHEEVTVYTYTMVREDQLGLCGFLSMDELSLFKQLITVSGIGPKAGLSLLSALGADDLRFAILSGDVKSIQSAPGIGKRTAERLILELKEKIEIKAGDTREVLPRADAAASAMPGEADAIEALAALGYARTDAMKAVRKASEDGVSGTEALLKAALKYIM